MYQGTLLRGIDDSEFRRRPRRSPIDYLFLFAPQPSWVAQQFIFSTSLCYKSLKTMDYIYQSE